MSLGNVFALLLKKTNDLKPLSEIRRLIQKKYEFPSIFSFYQSFKRF